MFFFVAQLGDRMMQSSQTVFQQRDVEGPEAKALFLKSTVLQQTIVEVPSARVLFTEDCRDFSR